jgi:hypothetical protein
MAFLRFTRDKRGYEHFYLVQPITNRRGKVRTRILYWFRTPPNVKVGREPFDEPLRRALEAQNPDVAFDWQKIVETPIPSAESERWRERRRQERAERAARQADAEDEEAPAELEATPVSATPEDAEEVAADEVEPVVEALPAPTLDRGVPPADQPQHAEQPQQERRRRRRRRGRRGRPPTTETPESQQALDSVPQPPGSAEPPESDEPQ